MKGAAHTVAWLSAAVAAFAGAAAVNGPLRDLRHERRITQADPLINAPPLVSFTTVALGGFRGMIADWLWIRAADLQDKGRYFEIVQLADWITKLEPRSPQVWAYHAWNMAYNISVYFDDPEDRWRWVRHGISLLRDQGLDYNPGDPELLFELGWMFQHKVGSSFDTAHEHYKRRWALEMSALFGGPRPDYDAPAAAHRRLIREYRLDPALMRDIDVRHGPLDWRLPDAHAIYWATRSLEVAEGFDRMRAARMIHQSLARAFHEGRLYTDPRDEGFITTPNPDLAPRVMDLLRSLCAEHPDDAALRNVFVDFMKKAIAILVTFGRGAEAQAILDELRTFAPGEGASGDLAAFLHGEVTGAREGGPPPAARDVIEGSLYQAAFWELLGDPARVAGFEEMARLYHEAYSRDAHEEGVPPLAELRAAARGRLDAEIAQP